jgi:predicted MFS family arabinose efflux permease
MSMSFMPLYAKQLYAPVSFLSEGYLLGAPLVAFVAVIALATPFAGSWVQRWGSRRIFVAGALPAVIGYVCAALAESIPQLIGARVLCALGYAMITISCQSYLADMVRSNRQTRDMSVFVMAVMTGVVCGAAIGAVLADRLGFRWTFACSAVLVLIASLCAGATMSNDRPPESERPIGVVRGMRYAFGEARFTALVFLAAVPAKLVLNGFLYYLTPLYLASLAISQPEIGRTIMMYGICMLVSIWVGARVADRFGHLPWQIGLSGLATGLGGLAVFALPPTQAILVAVIVLGLAQGFSSGPLLALVPRVSGAAAEMVGVQPMLGLLRSFERIGSILGPVIAATLVVAGGYINAVAWLSGIAAVTGVLFLVVFQLRGSK